MEGSAESWELCEEKGILYQTVRNGEEEELGAPNGFWEGKNWSRNESPISYLLPVVSPEINKYMYIYINLYKYHTCCKQH